MISVGIGAYIIRDELGPIATTGVNLAYSFRLETQLSYLGPCNIGVEGGYLQKSLNTVFGSLEG